MANDNTDSRGNGWDQFEPAMFVFNEWIYLN